MTPFQALSIAIFFFAFSSTCIALPAVGGFGKCPVVESQSTLDVSKYLGVWYEYVRFPAIFEPGLQCVKATYGLKDDGQVSVDNQGVFRIKVGERYVVNREFEARANATVCDPSKPAELCVRFSAFQPAPEESNYKIIDTDYDNYVLIYSCTQVTRFVNFQYAWILTRERGVQPANFDDLKKQLSSREVDVSKFIDVNQDQCTN